MASHWDEKRKEYRGSDWSAHPSIFAQEIVSYLPLAGKLLDLGAGTGQDSTFFSEQNYSVVSTDLVIDKQDSSDSIVHRQLDHSQPLPFEEETFDAVYCHLALHYFDTKTTEQIFAEIHRVLKPCGIVAFLVNSVNDPEYNTGTKIEDDYFETEGTKKRYFSAKTATEFAKNFKVILCDEKGETYKDRAKGVHNLVRFVGKKI